MVMRFGRQAMAQVKAAQAESLQATVADKIEFTGVGVHSGKPVCMEIFPAPVGAGVIFQRSDLDTSHLDNFDSNTSGPNTSGLDKPEIDTVVPAMAPLVVSSALCTTIRNVDGVEVNTTEHLLAAFAICGVTNAHVTLSSPELPIMDGSAAPFVAAIYKAGIAVQDAKVAFQKVTKPVEVRDGDRSILIEPGHERIIDVTIDFADPAIGRQNEIIDLHDETTLLKRLSPARTFCRLEDIEALRAAGLCLGGSLENAIVVGEDGVINEGGLRDPNEFVLHKALDLIGDLFLAGPFTFGRITAHKLGHDLNTKMARRLAHHFAQKADMTTASAILPAMA